MKVHTLSVVIGGRKCNASCPYCISKMTPDVCQEEDLVINYPRLKMACRLAQASGVTTALLTGKGEPTLYPQSLFQQLSFVKDFFPIIELQTNGICIVQNDISVQELVDQGLTTLAISVVHHDPDINSKILCGAKKYDFWRAVDLAHEAGASVRLSCILTKGQIDTLSDLLTFISEAQKHNVEQLTFRSVNAPDIQGDNKYYQWVQKHRIDEEEIAIWEETFKQQGTLLLNLLHNGRVYDFKGQNVCFYTCLTESTSPNDIRQLIYFPDGHLRYSWSYKGAILF